MLRATLAYSNLQASKFSELATSELMKDGGRYEDQFVGLLNDELLERAREMKRDGQGRFW